MHSGPNGEKIKERKKRRFKRLRPQGKRKKKRSPS
jgi:hypothetical protein